MEARPVQTILNDLLTEKAAITELSVLTNPSNVAIWYNLLGLFAIETNIMESLGVQMLADVNSRASEIPVGTLKWYSAETLTYQFGDSLTLIDGIPQYAVIDTTKRVVEQSAVTQQSGALVIKAGKTDLSGNTVPLSAAELSGLQQYWIEKRFAGVNLIVVSLNPDNIKAYVNIEIDGQILSLTGESLETPGTFPVIDAVKEYYKTVDFGGRMTVMELVDAIQSVSGVKNVVPTSILAKPDSGASFSEILDVSDQSYISLAGYLAEDATYPLSDTLTYYI